MDCVTVHVMECPCFFGSAFEKSRSRFKKIISMWTEREREVVGREEFQNRTDFAVNYQPFTNKLVFPTTQAGFTDYNYLSTDCFHLSQRGYAIATNAVWNNMMEPVSGKTEWWQSEFQQFKCPTQEMPYLRTRGNS